MPYINGSREQGSASATMLLFANQYVTIYFSLSRKLMLTLQDHQQDIFLSLFTNVFITAIHITGKTSSIS
jgi:hypothetical protein